MNHKALMLAQVIEGGAPYDEAEIVETIRAQHALIVQMREALGKQALNFASQHALLLLIGSPEFVSIRDETSEALKAATEYLEQKQ